MIFATCNCGWTIPAYTTSECLDGLDHELQHAYDGDSSHRVILTTGRV